MCSSAAKDYSSMSRNPALANHNLLDEALTVCEANEKHVRRSSLGNEIYKGKHSSLKGGKLNSKVVIVNSVIKRKDSSDKEPSKPVVRLVQPKSQEANVMKNYTNQAAVLKSKNDSHLEGMHQQQQLIKSSSEHHIASLLKSQIK